MVKPFPKASPDEAKKLSALIAAAKSAKAPTKNDQLEKYRDVLIKERMAGVKVRVISEALVKLGVTISEESVRLWFLRNGITTKPATYSPKPLKRVERTMSAPASPTKAIPTAEPVRGPRIARNDI